MEDFRLKNSVSRLEKEVDNLTRTVYNLKQQMSDALEQIKRLKGMDNDVSGK
jgi:hypothetical protein